jgi:hypothetical protein
VKRGSSGSLAILVGMSFPIITWVASPLCGATDDPLGDFELVCPNNVRCVRRIFGKLYFEVQVVYENPQFVMDLHG